MSGLTSDVPDLQDGREEFKVQSCSFSAPSPVHKHQLIGQHESPQGDLLVEVRSSGTEVFNNLELCQERRKSERRPRISFFSAPCFLLASIIQVVLPF
ncbi:hypothetical protein CHARACLAT_032493 [Characodon lateralis]|uniref:Uncharacterized protein n=1 Tax=Characodon lateralis TaxID=208331 RepID=A0ABU7DWP1_9TELE|nr:hypothetical protein [Characodon lateralis]